MNKIIPRRIFSPILKPRYFKTSCASNSASLSNQERKVKIGKYDINYLKVGNGPHNVLLMPGALGSIWTDFKPQVEGFDKEKFTVVAWDPPGYGKSRPPEREFIVDYFGQDVEPVMEFMKALNIPKFSIVGWSYGGATGMLIAAKYPEAIQKLVTWGCSTYLEPQELELYKKIRDVKTWSEAKRKPLVDLYGEERFAKLWAQVVDKMEADHYANKINFGYKLEGVKCPTLILQGEKDYLVGKSHAHYLQERIKGSRVHFYPKGKHDLHIVFAEDFNKRVQEFLLEK